MPLLVPCCDLRPGMSLYEPIVSNNKVMMQSGKPLNAAEIGAIERRFPGLSVRVADPVLDSVIKFEDDAADRDVAAQAQQRISRSMSQVQQRFAERTSPANAEFEALKNAVNEVMTYLKANPASAALITSCLDSRNYLSTHTGNVFYLSMLLGSTVLDYVAQERKRQTSVKELQYRHASDLTPLGLGAMAMDLGMIPLQSLIESEELLTEEGRRRIREHPSAGADLLPESFSSVTRMIVRTHHESFDGSGYPAGLPGKRLHVFSRIVRIADAYDAATSDRVFRGAKSPARVIWEMSVGPYRRFYDPVLMRAFAQLVQPFPIGSRLRLEDGRYAVVARYNRSEPFKPTVVVAFDDQDRPIPQSRLEDPVDLGRRCDLRIASCRGEDLSYLHGAETVGPAPPRVDFETALEAAYP